MASWHLENVEITAEKNPRSFFIPSLDERRRQKPGDIVRLHFVLKDEGPDLPRAERMWVEITEGLSADGNYAGILTNQPVHIKDLQLEESLQFKPCHIARTYIGKDDPRWIECGEKGALVSKMVFDKNEILRFAYREKPDREEDSGWRFFAGHEDDEYANDSKNIRICNVRWLVDFDPSIDEFIRDDYGAVFERQTIKYDWIRVIDWKIPDD
jgi:hypothetical protein